MSRWEDTALSLPKSTKDPIDALIESQTDDFDDILIQPPARIPPPPVNRREYDQPDDDYDSIYGDEDEAVGQDMRATGSSNGPIDFDSKNFPALGSSRMNSNYSMPSTSIKREEEEEYQSNDSVSSSIMDKIKSLEEENAYLLADREKLERRISELENMFGDTISGVSNHTQTSKDFDKLSATVLIDGREILISNLSPRMSGWDFTRRVLEATGKDPGQMIVMQHSPIQLELPIGQHGLGLRPFYAISLGHRRIERGRSIRVALSGRGPII